MADKEHNSEWISEVRNNESREDSLRMIEDALEVDSDNALLWVEAADLNLPPRSRSFFPRLNNFSLGSGRPIYFTPIT